MGVHSLNATTQLTVASAFNGPTSNERFIVREPRAGNYTVEVSVFNTPATVTFKLHVFALPATAAGNMAVSAPATAAAGATANVGLTFSGLDPVKRYYGEVQYDGTPFTVITVGPV